MEKVIYENKPLAFEEVVSVGIRTTIFRFDIEETENGWECEEICINHKEPHLEAAEVKKIVIDRINSKTDARILSGFQWNGINVWLSDENQRNFSEAQRVAMITSGQSLPMTFKLGEDANGSPVYHEFTTVEELTGFYLSAVAYINQCLNEGWQEKDNTDWSLYGISDDAVQ